MNQIYLVLNNNKPEPKTSTGERKFDDRRKTAGFSNLFAMLPAVPEEKRQERDCQNRRKSRAKAGIKDISSHYKHVRGRIVLSNHPNTSITSQSSTIEAITGDTVLDVGSSSPVGSLSSRTAPNAFSLNSDDDSEDFDAQSRRLSHYVKTTDYEQSRIRELKVTIEFLLSARFKDLLICKCVSQFLGQISPDEFAWVEQQAAEDYFVCELRGPQFKSFVWYLAFYDDPPLEVDTQHWDLERKRYACTVLLFTLLFPLVIPGVFFRCLYESILSYINIWGIRFSTYSLMWKFLLVIICPFMFFIWMFGTLLLAFLLVFIRTIFIPSDLLSGWSFMCAEHQWAQWISSIHKRAYWIRALYDDCFSEI